MSNPSLSPSPSLPTPSFHNPGHITPPRLSTKEERQLFDFSRRYVQYRLSQGYKWNDVERVQDFRCQSSYAWPALPGILASYYFAYPFLGRYTSSHVLRLAAFLIPQQLSSLVARRYAERRCQERVALRPNSPLAHDIRTALRARYADEAWLQPLLEPYDDADAAAKGTGLPILLSIPSSSADAPSTLTPDAATDSPPLDSDLPSPDAESALRPPDEAVQKRPLVSVQVNDRPLFSLPPGRTSTAASPPFASTTAPPSMAPSTAERPLAALGTATRVKEGKGAKGESVWAEDDFGLDDEGVGRTAAKVGSRGDEAERRTRREERRKTELERKHRVGRSGGERRRPVRVNEFGDEMVDD